MKCCIKIILITIFITTVFISGCNVGNDEKSKSAVVKLTNGENGENKEFKAIVIDDNNQKFGLSRDVDKVVSLAPAVTEIIFAIDGGGKIVGNTTYCNYPEEAKDVEKIGDFQNPSIEKIVSLKPDLVFATGGVQDNIVNKLEEQKIPVFIIDPSTYDETLDSILKIGAFLGKIKESAEIAKEMEEKKKEIEEKVKDKKRVKTFIELGSDPLYTAGKGTFPDDLINIAGGENVAKDEGWLPYSIEVLIEENPQVYLAIKGDMYDPGNIKERPNMQSIDAIKNGMIVIIKDDLITLSGPRLMEGLEAIAGAIHPELFKK